MLRNILTSNTFLLFFAFLWLRLVFATENSGCHGGKRMVTISLKASCATMKSWKSWLFGYFVNNKKSLTMDDKSKNHSRSRDYRCRTDEDKAGFRQNAETGKAGFCERQSIADQWWRNYGDEAGQWSKPVLRWFGVGFVGGSCSTWTQIYMSCRVSSIILMSSKSLVIKKSASWF